MIHLDCTSCHESMQIDDAFAGGVCRCRHCGTIQTVPARGQAAKSGTTAAAKTLFHGPAGRRGNSTLATDPTAAVPRSLRLLLGASAGMIVVLLVVIVLLMIRGRGPASAGAAPVPPQPVPSSHE